MRTLNANEAKERIAKNIAEFFNSNEETTVINLGVGIPNRVANYITNENVFIQGENGMLGVGALAKEGEVLENLINSGREPVKETNGCSYFDSATAFGMIRGGYVDAAVIGGFEVDKNGDVANWIIPNGKQLGVGGAMDLVGGANTLIISMRHMDKHGKSKLLNKCNLPLTGVGKVDYVVTEYAIFHFTSEGVTLLKKSEDIEIEEIEKITEFKYNVSKDLKIMV